MNFTREPIIETIITPKDGYKLVVRNSSGNNQEEYLVDAVEVVSFGKSYFFRSLERPKAFLLPVSDYEIFETRETRVVLKKSPVEKTIKIPGGRTKSERGRKSETPIKEQPKSETNEKAETESKPEKKRERRRRRRPVAERQEKGKEEEQEGGSDDETKVSSKGFRRLLPPPPGLISEKFQRPPVEETVEEVPKEPIPPQTEEEASLEGEVMTDPSKEEDKEVTVSKTSFDEQKETIAPNPYEEGEETTEMLNPTEDNPPESRGEGYTTEMSMPSKSKLIF